MGTEVLGFSDRRTGGLLAVNGGDGQPVALIDASSTGRRFTAVTADRTPLCGGQVRHFFSRSYDLVDGSGRPLGSVRAGAGKRHDVFLSGGIDLQIQGTWFGRDWQLVDHAGTALLSSVPTRSAWSFRPDEWLIKSAGQLDLAQIVAIVETYRILVKVRRASRAGGGAAGG